MSDALEQAIDRALENGKPIWIRAHLLRDAGENALQEIVTRLFDFYGQPVMASPVHAAIRELVQNASKASLKRIVFEDLGLDPLNAADYEKGILLFRKYLVESQLSRYRKSFARRGLDFTIRFEHRPYVVLATVENRAELLPHEEARVRDKFRLAQELDNLFDFYIKFGDNTEGAGMGIAMVEILLQEAGIERHNFTIACVPDSGTTTARILVPLSADYVAPRVRFAKMLAEGGQSADALRTLVRSGKVDLDPLKER